MKATMRCADEGDVDERARIPENTIRYQMRRWKTMMSRDQASWVNEWGEIRGAKGRLEGREWTRWMRVLIRREG